MHHNILTNITIYTTLTAHHGSTSSVMGTQIVALYYYKLRRIRND
jgi:hypothetical protein